MDKETLDVYESALDECLTDNSTISPNMVHELAYGLDSGFKAEQLQFMLDNCQRDKFLDDPSVCENIMREIREQMERGMTLEEMSYANELVDRADASDIKADYLAQVCDLIWNGVSREGTDFFAEFKYSGGELPSNESPWTFKPFSDPHFTNDKMNGNFMVRAVMTDLSLTLKSGVDVDRIQKYGRKPEDHGFPHTFVPDFSVIMTALRSGFSDTEMDMLMEHANNEMPAFEPDDPYYLQGTNNLFITAYVANKGLTMSLSEDSQHSGIILDGIIHNLNDQSIHYLETLLNDRDTVKVNNSRDRLAIIDIMKDGLVGGLSIQQVDDIYKLYGKDMHIGELKQVYELAVAQKGIEPTSILKLTDKNEPHIKYDCEHNFIKDRRTGMEKMCNMFKAGFSNDMVDKYWNAPITDAVLNAYSNERHLQNGRTVDDLLDIQEKYGANAIAMVASLSNVDSVQVRNTINIALAADIENLSDNPNRSGYESVVKAELSNHGNEGSVLYGVQRYRENIDKMLNIGTVDELAQMADLVGVSNADAVLDANENNIPVSLINNAVRHGVQVDDITNIVSQFGRDETPGIFNALENGVTMEQINQYYPHVHQSPDFFYGELTKAITANIDADVIKDLHDVIQTRGSEQNTDLAVEATRLVTQYDEEHSVENQINEKRETANKINENIKAESIENEDPPHNSSSNDDPEGRS